MPNSADLKIPKEISQTVRTATLEASKNNFLKVLNFLGKSNLRHPGALACIRCHIPLLKCNINQQRNKQMLSMPAPADRLVRPKRKGLFVSSLTCFKADREHLVEPIEIVRHTIMRRFRQILEDCRRFPNIRRRKCSQSELASWLCTTTRLRPKAHLQSRL